MKQDFSIPYNELPTLPPKAAIESKRILNQAIKSNVELARLKGYCFLLPNETISVSYTHLRAHET